MYRETATYTFYASTWMHCPSVSSWWLPLLWTRRPPPGPQPEPAVGHPPELGAWPSCSAGHTPKSKSICHMFHFKDNLNNLIFQSNILNEYNHEGRRTVVFSYFSIVNLKEADIGREIHVSKPPMVDVGENILGWKRKDSNYSKSSSHIGDQFSQMLNVP